jgi:hypothetical protein
MHASFAQIPFRPQHLVQRTTTQASFIHVIIRTFPRRVLMIAALAASLILLCWLPCSSARAAERALPPSPELVAAEAALARAESVDAQQYAPEALLRARNTFGQAQAKWAERRKPDAIALAQLAAAEADFAYTRSREAAVQSDLTLRRNEIRELRAKLGIGGVP